MKRRLPYLLILFIFLFAVPIHGNDEPLSCADKSVVASAVRTQEDVQAFVQCAYELVQEVRTEAARQAFHEKERWRSGPIDAFGNDLFLDAHSIVRDFGEGWLYNSFHNPTSGRDEPKVSYIKGIEWEGVRLKGEAPHETEKSYAKRHPKGRWRLRTALSPRNILHCPVEAYPSLTSGTVRWGVRIGL